MKKLFLLLIFFPMLIYSQTKTVSGTVNDTEGAPLPGASIVIKGTSIGTSTDFDGKFTINIPNDGKTLVVSYLGFRIKEVKIGTAVNFTIQLEPDANTLEEVVVIGYGTVLKKDATGAVTTVKINDEVANQSSSVDQLLQGRAAGVQVTQNGGTLGGGISVKIRGTNSLRGNNEPLYVIDGVIVASAGEDVDAAGGIGNSGQETQNGLNGINPRDIESISILKDASATAIYGSRGANGVVLITTKKGKQGKVTISSFMTTSIRSIEKKYDVLDGLGYANYINESRALLGGNADDVLPVYEINGSNIYGITYETDGTSVVSETPAQLFNWQDEMFNQSFSTKVGGSASGGSEKGSYYISAGFDDQKGIVDNSTFKSGDLRINLSQKLNKNLKLNGSVSAFISDSNFSESGDLIGANQSFIRNAIGFKPVITEEIDDFADDLDNANPYAWVDDFQDVSKEKRYFGSLSLNYNLPIKGLSYEIKAGGNIRTKDRRRFYGLTTYQGKNANGALQISTLNTSSYQINNFLRFNRSFGKKHRVTSLLGVTYDVRNVDRSIYAVEDFITTEKSIEQPFLGSTISQPLLFGNSDQQIFSVLGRFNYTYNDKYVLTASFRRDEVSKFADGFRVGFFPSFALAWRLGDEKFIENLNFFDDLKVRVGWGQIGNHGINPYGTISDYSPTGLYGTPSGGTTVPITLNNLANQTVTWETTEQLNVGIDFATNNNRVSGSIDVYDKTSKDLLQAANLGPSTGFETLIVNRGAVANKGFELSLNVSPIQQDNFELTLGGNIAFNKTKIEELGDETDFYIDGEVQQRAFYYGSNISRGNIFKSPANVFVEGEESGLFYGFVTDGIYQSDDIDIISGKVPGDVRIIDQNGDGIIDLKDRTFIGNPNPDFVYGFNVNLKYKRLTANIAFNGVYGNDIANGNLLQLATAEGTFGVSTNNIIPEAYNDAWRTDNPSNTYPRIGYTNNAAVAISDRIIEDGSYLRLSNVTIGYDVPVKKTGLFDRLNIYIAGQNLVTWTNYSGYNPEISSFLYTGLINGVDWNGSPNASTLSLGVNVNF